MRIMTILSFYLSILACNSIRIDTEHWIDSEPEIQILLPTDDILWTMYDGSGTGKIELFIDKEW